MIIGLTSEQTERLYIATKAYRDEIANITKELLDKCETSDDVEMAAAVIRVAMQQASAKLEVQN